MGVPQSDLTLIKTIIDGLAYIRQNPWQLDFIFEGVMSDNLKTQFGREEIARAKKWFLTTNIPVTSEWRFDKPVYPCVTVAVKSSIEAQEKSALGEINPQVMGQNTVEKAGYVTLPDISVGPFTPAYDPDTGIVTLPDGFDTTLIFVNQGLYVPSTGTTYVISEINSDSSFTIDENIHENMTGAYVVPAYSNLKLVKRISNFNEVYEINCIVKGSPGELYWLHAIISYILLQRRQYLLEKFNIGLTSISSGEISGDQNDAETFFSKTITMNGYVEVAWVDDVSEYIEGVSGEITFAEPTEATEFPSLLFGGSAFASSEAESTQGEQGEQGPPGPQGAPGATGAPGAKVAGANFGDGFSSDSIFAGQIAYVRVPYSATISQWDLVTDVSCTCTVDIWKAAGGLPTIANTITGSTKPNLSGATVGESSTLTGWTTTVTSGDVLAFNLLSLSGSPSQIAITIRMIS